MEYLKSQIESHRKAGDLADFCRRLHDSDEAAFKVACKKYLSYSEIKDCVFPIFKSMLDGLKRGGDFFDVLFLKLNDRLVAVDDDGCQEFLWTNDCGKYWEGVFAEPFDDLVLWPLLTEDEKKEFRVLHHFRLLEELWADDEDYPGRSEFKNEVLDYCSKLFRQPHDSFEYKKLQKLLAYFDEENLAAFKSKVS
ncbi:MAG: hypothetical protein IK015_00040 [Treponema sp.]|nr:hypothetical protein [Treponema sp.]